MNEKKSKRYWKSLQERAGAEQSQGAQDGPAPRWDPLSDTTFSRRSFLKTAGFFFGAGIFSSCSRAPGFRSIPHLIGTEESIPGQATWYATTCGGCSAACGALVKIRDGRPIKIEGNPGHPLSRGGLCAVGQACVLGLYDSRRLASAHWRGVPTPWDNVDARVDAALDAARSSGKAVRVLTGTVHSPTLRRVIGRLLASCPGAKHVEYDALSSSAIREAHARTHARRVLPRYRFERADVIVSIDSDFLGAWISPVEHAAGWRQGRVPKGTPPRMSYHVQFETRMSLTGSNADRRVPIPAGTEALVAAHLAQEVARRAGAILPYGALDAGPIDIAQLRSAADRLWAARDKALIVCGTNDAAAQAAVNHANEILGAYGRTLDLRRPSQQRQGDDTALEELIEELRAGKIGVLFVHGCDPAAELPAPKESWEKTLAKVGLVVTTSTHLDETARAAGAVCPDHHFLESWLDAEPARGVAAVVQPVIEPLAGTRSALESFARWAGTPLSAREQVRAVWREDALLGPSETAWIKTVHDGWAVTSANDLPMGSFNPRAAGALAPKAPAPAPLSLLLYPKISMLEGRHSQNPWLHELPDPVTKVVWDNYASVSPKTAEALGAAQGDVVRLEARAASLELPLLVQPGQTDGSVCVALGYGRAGTERFFDVGPSWISGKPTVPKGGRVGANASVFLAFTGGAVSSFGGAVTVEKTGRVHPLACTQEYHSLQMPARLAEHPGERRDIVRETTLAEYSRSPSSGNPEAHPITSLWPKSMGAGDRRWAMAIDLNLCSGCSACVIACQAENNVPVVGKDEVGRRRDMAWLRIDRYYADGADGIETVHQPMLCQQCGNAPCETVCPVVATAGSEDGLNQQVYNRCVGTRYCANNCPYKVRRFNWFEYRNADARENLVLNPDVTVRSRGVMEKCSFCVQRIQEAKIEAKRRGEPVRDGDVRTACQQSCPTQAIVFGDANAKDSLVAQGMRDPRRYRVLEELHVDPAVGYLTKVNNRVL